VIATLDTPASVTEPNWKAVVHYYTESGLVDLTHDIEELGDLESLVERGPHWDCIDRIEITRTARSYETLTIEQAKEL
jgi:hypothetical protein